MSDFRKRFTESAQERTERLTAEATEGPELTENQYKAQSRRSFLTGAAGIAAGFAGWRTLQGRPADGNVPDVLRKGYEFNEAVWKTIGSQSKLAPTFALSDATSIRVNGRRGLGDDLDLETWELRIEDLNGDVLETFDVESMTDVIGSLPQKSIVVEHKCIEGWSARPHWGGVSFSDFAERYASSVPPDYNYVAMSTPDDGYFVGVDRPTMLNAQTMLVTHLGGEPLDSDHGAPLRMATPHKYGIKSIKRIGTLRFTNEQPEDFWANRGYTYWAGF